MKQDQTRRIAELDALASRSADLPPAYDFKPEDLYCYVRGEAEPGVVQVIEAERKLDPDLDNEIRYLEAIAHVSPETSSAQSKRPDLSRWVTGGLSTAACALALFSFIQLNRGPSFRTLLETQAGSVVAIGSEKYWTAPLSPASLEALKSGSFPASSGWNAVYRTRGEISLNEMKVTSQMDTTIEGNTYNLSFECPEQVEPDRLIVFSGGATKEYVLDSESKVVTFSDTGNNTLVLRGFRDNGDVVRSEFRIRVMTDAERASYRQEIAAAKNPLDQLAVFAKYGFTAEFNTLHEKLGNNAPMVSPSQIDPRVTLP